LLEHSGADSEAAARSQFESLLEQAFESGLATDAVVAENIAQAQQLWHIRESIPMGQAEEGLNIKHDISVPISRIAQFCSHTEALLHKAIEGVRLVNFGHLGDGNLHYNVQAPLGQDPQVFLKNFETTINQIVYDSVFEHGGSISAEHGIGSLKRDTLEKYKSPVALNLMRRIKEALDPLGTLNPGRVVALSAK
jgi:FAD/FMN-containing dehydrogenase